MHIKILRDVLITLLWNTADIKKGTNHNIKSNHVPPTQLKKWNVTVFKSLECSSLFLVLSTLQKAASLLKLMIIIPMYIFMFLLHVYDSKE